MYDYAIEDLESSLSSLGVKKGACVFLHSAMKSTGKINPGSHNDQFSAILETLLGVLGPLGSLIVPTFNFSFCQGEIFDYENTPGVGMGAFSEFVRCDSRAIRSSHPFHSIAAIGHIAEAVGGATGFSEFSAGSAFDVLLKSDVKILFYGVDFVETFTHIAEERAAVPYRYWKIFNGKIRKSGREHDISVNFFARRFDMKPEPVVDVPKLGRYCKTLGIFTEARLGNGLLAIADGNQMVDALEKKFKINPNFALEDGP
jgi:aminoglycoside 3-N-acetyltransferase